MASSTAKYALVLVSFAAAALTIEAKAVPEDANFSDVLDLTGLPLEGKLELNQTLILSVHGMQHHVPSLHKIFKDTAPELGKIYNDFKTNENFKTLFDKLVISKNFSVSLQKALNSFQWEENLSEDVLVNEFRKIVPDSQKTEFEDVLPTSVLLVDHFVAAIRKVADYEKGIVLEALKNAIESYRTSLMVAMTTPVPATSRTPHVPSTRTPPAAGALQPGKPAASSVTAVRTCLWLVIVAVTSQLML